MRPTCAALLAGLFLCLSVLIAQAVDEITPALYEERVVFQIEEGDVEFGFYVDVAPVTVQHIFEVATLGLYTSTTIFRVDKGFVAQTQEVGGRTLPMNEKQKEVASKSLPLEVKEGVRHHEGVLSMARANNPNSGTSSIFFCYGTSKHLDMQYAAFGRVTKGMDVLHKLESLPTKKEGIFVMPLKKITILNSYWYRMSGPVHLSMGAGGAAALPTGDKAACVKSLQELSDRFTSEAEELQRVRKKCLPML